MRRSEEFQTTIRRGVRSRAGTLVLHGRRVPGRTGTQVGFVVAGSVGGAVVRNRVRRRLRGLVVDHRRSLPAGADLVVRALPLAGEAEFQTLADDFSTALATVSARIGERS